MTIHQQTIEVLKKHSDFIRSFVLNHRDFFQYTTLLRSIPIIPKSQFHIVMEGLRSFEVTKLYEVLSDCVIEITECTSSESLLESKNELCLYFDLAELMRDEPFLYIQTKFTKADLLNECMTIGFKPTRLG